MLHTDIGAVYAPGTVALGGSRSLPSASAGWVGQLALALAGRGLSIVTGCCVGADAAAVYALAGLPALTVLAQFGPVSPPWHGMRRYTAPGAFCVSAVGAVAAHATAGGAVRWWAGGGQAVPAAARLAARTLAVAQACTAGVVVVMASPSSHGSLRLARTVAARGLPVVAVCWGFSSSLLPALGPGSWAPLGSPVGPASAAVWGPVQGVLL